MSIIKKFTTLYLFIRIKIINSNYKPHENIQLLKPLSFLEFIFSKQTMQEKCGMQVGSIYTRQLVSCCHSIAIGIHSELQGLGGVYILSRILRTLL